jgi:GT2 family glycosyltransferase
MTDVPAEIRRLAEERAAARAAKDFARADALRDELASAGWRVVDGAGGFHLEPLADEPVPRVRADEVPSALDEPATADVSLQWVCEGWPEDIDRAIAAFRRFLGETTLQLVVVDVTGEPVGRWGDDVEVVSLGADAGWAAARNAGLRRARGHVVVVLDPSLEPVGDALGRLVSALDDPAVGVAGPFGIVTRDLRSFEEAAGAGPADAIEAYLMAFRRAVLREVGGFDERFRWYRSADIEWSFRVKDAGYRVEVVDVPVRKHEHRMWASTSPEDRAQLSKRNFNLFLGRWRDRWDLVLAGSPEDAR